MSYPSGSCNNSSGDERLVLSEVHIGSSATDEAELVSRYPYLTPSLNNLDDDSSSNSSSDSDSDNEGERRRGSSNGVARGRKRTRADAEAASTETASQRRSRPAHEVLTIVHKMATTLGLVGQQVWSAAFLLGDFVLTHEALFAGAQVVELGAGPGVAGLVAARVARKCYLTDYHPEVLALLARNVEANRHLFSREVEQSTNHKAASAKVEKPARNGDEAGGGHLSTLSGAMTEYGGHGGGGVDGNEHTVAVRKLDWFTFSREIAGNSESCSSAMERDQDSDDCGGDEGTTAATTAAPVVADGGGGAAGGPFAWQSGELDGLLARPHGNGTIILAADVIYDEGLTEALFDALRMLMPPPPLVGNGDGDSRKVVQRDNTAHSGFSGNSTGWGAEQPPQPPPPLDATSEHGVDMEVDGDPPGRKDVRGEPPRAVVAVPAVSSPDDNGHPFFHGSVRHHKGGGGEGGQAAVLYLALEKRFNFSLAELSVAATGYSALLRNVVDVTDGDAGPAAGKRGAREHREFQGTRLPLTFRQCFRYQRSDAMEVWEIRRRPI